MLTSRRLFRLALLLAPCVPLATCAKEASDGGKPVVVASIFPIYDLVRQVAGDDVEVVLLLPAGRSEHDYQPTVAEVKQVSRAKLAFLVGLELDEWAARMVEASAGQIPMIRLGDGLGEAHEEPAEEDHHDEPEEGGEHHHHHGAVDPHVWLSVPKAQLMVGRIREELDKAFPGKPGFNDRWSVVFPALQSLDAEIRRVTLGFPRKKLVTFHGAFGYFAKEYGLEIAAVIEPYPGKQPSAAYLRRVLDQIKRADAKALYTEPQLDRRPAEVLAQESGLPVRVLDPLGGLEGRQSYPALMRFNLAALAESMQ